ncbi:MAG: nitrogenase component I subunit alpha [Coriobacteriales bacterium]|jgi:nitrogenase molybdenum-iron protein alpha chain|nr:nitrogenase component I subunit alpha [Coriobacteriales bacterium]
MKNSHNRTKPGHTEEQLLCDSAQAATAGSSTIHTAPSVPEMGERTGAVIDEVLESYEAKVFRNRKKHLLMVDHALEAPQEIAANSRTIPGILSHRGCCYAGCKGVVLGPIKDALIIVHGPIGCSFYTWGTRRHKASSEPDKLNLVPYTFSTDMHETDIVFGGEKKLFAAIEEGLALFKPEAVLICSTCPVGLIGDDIHAVAARAEKQFGVTCVAFSCEGYKGVSQSAGHHIASNELIRRIIGTNDSPMQGTYRVNLLGEYNIGGDGWETERILKRCGITIVSVMSGDGSIADITRAHTADLNLVQCHRSINYIAEMMQTQYGIDWLKVNFVGISAIQKSLRQIAAYFDNLELSERIEAVIADELAEIDTELRSYRDQLSGKTAALYVGGSRSHHYQSLLKDLGMQTVIAGYEFAHRDDYEGREVKESIKVDADNKNIEELSVEPIEGKYRLRISPEKLAQLKASIASLEQYEGMIKEMDNGTLVIDDLNHFEAEKFVEALKPDVFFSGIKDKYVLQKGGVFSRQLHSYDYKGPYAGFKGAINFAQDLLMGLQVPAWQFISPPWRHEPLLRGHVDAVEEEASVPVSTQTQGADRPGGER